MITSEIQQTSFIWNGQVPHCPPIESTPFITSVGPLNCEAIFFSI
uniref:Uncharacterized protein n=1 Tax=Anguilla anguilla TaxID=7936 RepID=A0A0E9RM02_ANGAN